MTGAALSCQRGERCSQELRWGHLDARVKPSSDRDTCPRDGPEGHSTFEFGRASFLGAAHSVAHNKGRQAAR